MNNISIKNLQQVIKKMFEFRGEDPEKMEITPYRDWRMVVAVFFVGLIASLVFNMYIFVGVNQDNFFRTVSKQEEVVGLNQGKLLTVLEVLNAKKTAFETLTKGSVSVVDPSL